MKPPTPAIFSHETLMSVSWTLRRCFCEAIPGRGGADSLPSYLLSPGISLTIRLFVLCIGPRYNGFDDAAVKCADRRQLPVDEITGLKKKQFISS